VLPLVYANRIKQMSARLDRLMGKAVDKANRR